MSERDLNYPPVRIERGARRLALKALGSLLISLLSLGALHWLDYPISPVTIVIIFLLFGVAPTSEILWRVLGKAEFVEVSAAGFAYQKCWMWVPVRVVWSDIAEFRIENSEEAPRGVVCVLDKVPAGARGFQWSPPSWRDPRRIRLMDLDVGFYELVALLEKYRKRYDPMCGDGR